MSQQPSLVHASVQVHESFSCLLHSPLCTLRSGTPECNEVSTHNALQKLFHEGKNRRETHMRATRVTHFSGETGAGAPPPRSP